MWGKFFETIHEKRLMKQAKYQQQLQQKDLQDLKKNFLRYINNKKVFLINNNIDKFNNLDIDLQQEFIKFIKDQLEEHKQQTQYYLMRGMPYTASEYQGTETVIQHVLDFLANSQTLD